MVVGLVNSVVVVVVVGLSQVVEAYADVPLVPDHRRLASLGP